MSDPVIRQWNPFADPPWRLPDAPPGYFKGVSIQDRPTFDENGAPTGKTEVVTWAVYLDATDQPVTSPIVVLDGKFQDPDHEAARIALAQEDVRQIAIRASKEQIELAVKGTLDKAITGTALSADENRALLVGLAFSAGKVSHEEAATAVGRISADVAQTFASVRMGDGAPEPLKPSKLANGLKVAAVVAALAGATGAGVWFASDGDTPGPVRDAAADVSD